MSGTPQYVEYAVLVSARVAELYDRVLSAPRVADVLDRVADPEEIATREAFRRAAKALSQSRAIQRSGETGEGVDDPAWRHEAITTGEAARMLDVSVRRAQQLAAGGLGHRNAAGRWLLDAAAVAAMAEHRDSA